MLTLILISSMVVAADAPKSEGNSATMKSVLKDAIKVDTSDGGEAPAGPDVSKMRLSPENIKTVIAYYQPQIQACYEETLANKDKAVEGKLMTSWVIGAEGVPTRVKIVKKGTTLKDPHLHNCVISVLSAIVFPKPQDGKPQPIEFPFNLKAIH